MDEGERYIEGKIHFLNEHNSGNLALPEEALFNVKTDVSATEVEENHYQNLKFFKLFALHFIGKSLPVLNIPMWSWV